MDTHIRDTIAEKSGANAILYNELAHGEATLIDDLTVTIPNFKQDYNLSFTLNHH